MAKELIRRHKRSVVLTHAYGRMGQWEYSLASDGSVDVSMIATRMGRRARQRRRFHLPTPFTDDRLALDADHLSNQYRLFNWNPRSRKDPPHEPPPPFLSRRLRVLSVLAGAGCATVAPMKDRRSPRCPRRSATDKPCSRALALTPTPNVNATSGWTAKPAAGQPPLTCNLKLVRPRSTAPTRRSVPAICVGTQPNDPKDRGKEWHGLVDLLNGSILACAQPSNRFGVRGQIDCETKTYSATPTAPIRVVLPVTVPRCSPAGVSRQRLRWKCWCARRPGSGPIAIGQIGFAEQASNPSSAKVR